MCLLSASANLSRVGRDEAKWVVEVEAGDHRQKARGCVVPGGAWAAVGRDSNRRNDAQEAKEMGIYLYIIQRRKRNIKRIRN